MAMKPKPTSRVRLWALTTCAGSVLAMLTGAAHADPAGPAPKLADQHAPAGVMFDHMHKAGEFMVGVRSELRASAALAARFHAAFFLPSAGAREATPCDSSF